MAQASTLVPVTKTKKHKRGRLRYHGGGIVGLVAFLAIFVIPLRRFMPGLKSDSAETKLIATLGTLHVLAVMIYCLSQSFFAHNSGNLFYFFLTIVWYALFTTQQGNIKKMS